jgi:NAD(P)-dependent dehydrogenase (short-subunit alcohol dehydrogenase family)
MRQFAEKVALITGSHAGIGRATALAFATQGAQVVVSARREKIWLITGSSRGLGRAIAEAVPAKGDKLVATARNTKPLERRLPSWPRTTREVDRFDCAICGNVMSHNTILGGH